MAMKKFTLLVLAAAVIAALTACGQSKQSAGGTPAPSAAVPAASSGAAAKHWSKAPEMSIDPNKSYQAQFDTSKGSFTVDLFAKEAPVTVNNFIFLAKQGFYNGVLFHRIIQSFMIQTGDPTGTGMGGPGYRIPDELKTSHKYEEGIVAMANTGQPNSGGSQFFVCTGPDCANLNQMPNYTIFGKVSAGMDAVKSIAATPVQMKPGGADSSPSSPKEPVTIKTIKITEK